MLAIQNIKTGEFVYGTDYRYSPPRQRTSLNQVRTYENLAQAKSDYLCRRCGKNYRIVCLKRVEVKRVIDFDSDGEYHITGKDWRNTGGKENAD